jgi:hypothetical protein
LDIDDLVDGLKKLGIKLPEKTIVRWAYTDQVITKPEWDKQKGRGKKSDWPSNAVEEVAAVWAVRNTPVKRHVPKEKIEMIKAAAACAYRYPSTFYDPPRTTRITGPDPTSQWAKPWHLWTTMIHPNDELNALATTWIAALEKAKRDAPVSKPKRVVFHWRSRPREEEKTIPLGRLGGYNVFAIGGPDARKHIEASKARPDQDLPSSFLIKDPRDPDGGPLGFQQEYTRAVVSPHAPHGWDLFPLRWTFDIEKIELEDALHDEIVFLLDGRDSRIKAFYAPYDAYDPSVDYEKRAGSFGLNSQNQTGTQRDAKIDSLIEDSRSLINEISPLLSTIDRERVRQRMIFSVQRLIPATYMHRVRWKAPPPMSETTTILGTSKST